ncbi:hypothetical protein D9M69_410270 [compost metagenome]
MLLPVLFNDPALQGPASGGTRDRHHEWEARLSRSLFARDGSLSYLDTDLSESEPVSLLLVRLCTICVRGFSVDFPGSGRRPWPLRAAGACPQWGRRRGAARRLVHNREASWQVARRVARNVLILRGDFLSQ